MAKAPEVFAVFDLETNGLKGASALSASSIVFDGDGRILDFFNRFYYSEERPNPRTEAVHGLTPGRITHLRGDDRYPRYFLEDWRSLAAFWDRWSPGGIIVHNLTFDVAFLPPGALRGRKWWCSMKGLTEYCRIPAPSPGRGPWKWPRQEEASGVVRGNIEPTRATKAYEEAVGLPLPHFGLSDCFELYGIFSRVWNAMADRVVFGPPPRRRLLPPVRQDYPHAVVPKDLFVEERLSYSARVASVMGNSPGGAGQEMLF